MFHGIPNLIQNFPNKHVIGKTFHKPKAQMHSQLKKYWCITWFYTQGIWIFGAWSSSCWLGSLKVISQYGHTYRFISAFTGFGICFNSSFSWLIVTWNSKFEPDNFMLALRIVIEDLSFLSATKVAVMLFGWE